MNQKLAQFYALAKELANDDEIDPRELVAAVQLQLPTDIIVTTTDKVNTMVSVGLIQRHGNRVFHPVTQPQ